MIARTLLISSAFIFASASFAQQAQPAAANSSSAGNCVARHDHGAEKGTPSPKNCIASETAKEAASAASGKKVAKGHDHAKVHKNQ